MTRLTPRSLALAISAATVGPALAQDAAPILLDEIVITASGFAQSIADAPASITVLSGDELRRRNVTSLSDALRDVQGVATTGIANEQDITIRGLPGQYTLILVDGVRQGTRQSRTNGDAGYEQSFIPPVAAIERIEVVRGPMSSLYGSDAMGGVINIITRPVPARWGGSVSAEVTVPQRDRDGGTRQLSFSAGGPVVADVLGLQVWGRSLQRSEARVIDGARDRDLTDIAGRLTWTAAPGHDIRLEGGRTRIEDLGRVGRTIPAVDFRGTPQNDSLQTHDRNHRRLSYGGTWGDLRADLSVQRETGTRRTASGNGAVGLSPADRAPEVRNTVYDAKLTAPLSWRGSHVVTFGGQIDRARVRDQNPGLGDGAVHDFGTRQSAIFAEDEWRITPDLALTLGARAIEHREFGRHVTPRAYAVWQAGPSLTVKGGVSTGFRAPDVRAIVPGYFYTTERGAGVIVSNPGLSPEESTSYELAVLHEGGAVSLGATLFRTDFRDRIESFKTDDRITVGGQGFNRWDWRNIGRARLQGVELTADWDAGADVTLRAAYSLVDSEQRSGALSGLPLTRTPRHTASLTADWITPVDGLEAWGRVTYHGREIAAGARVGTNGRPYATDETGAVIAYEYGSALTADLGASWQVAPSVTLNGAIHNILDRDITMEANNTVGQGRSLWLGLSTDF
ncbi:TonB-dependent receptor [Paracoccus aestuarii]|uniref:TonB-dependent receptor n=1 Tax=Paracoccus aestuarii TaxID=453842 RepID=A0A418ZVU6_9RHOB|nr:TonB-dependent receptor [Paracoccus aestuarii]RJL03992.1 TonB-dependent receptor [Paracoccus aestuarii]WCQ99309.1 TonB-dependent receptor [Paracoccus aestuarii]